jgi:YVTN family beta-propeller protein
MLAVVVVVLAAVGVDVTVSGGAAVAGTSPPVPTAYVANFGDGTVTPIDLLTGMAGAPIKVGANADAVAVTPDGATAYVANWGDGTVTPIATATGTAGAPIKVGRNPIAIAVTPDGKTLYVVNNFDGTVTPIATATGTAGAPIEVGFDPCDIAVTPDGATVYVANRGDNTVTPIDTATGKPGAPIKVGNGPDAVAVTPDGATAYVANYYGDTVTPIDTATGKPGPPIKLGSFPSLPAAVAVTPDGATAYTANSSDGTVTPIDTATGTAGAPVEVGNNPQAIAIRWGWAPQATVPAAATTAGPALAAYNGATYAAWADQATGAVTWSAYSGTWASPQPVSGIWGTALTGTAPALVAYGGRLYAFWAGLGGGTKIWYSAYNGTTWSAQATLSGTWGAAATSQPPAVAAYGGDLYAAWTDQKTGKVTVAYYNGASWGPPDVLAGTTADAPALADDAGTGALVVAWTTSTGKIDWLNCCTAPVHTLPHAQTSAAPAVAAMNLYRYGTVYFAWKGPAKNKIYYEAAFNTTVGYGDNNFTHQQILPQALTSAAPALAVNGTTLWAAWKGNGTGTKLWYATGGAPLAPNPAG